MDAHFSKVLSQHTHRSSDPTPALPSTSTKDYVQFIPAAKFEGRRHGYKFKNGSKGVGYYFDIVQIREQDRMMGVQENSTGGDVHSNKRKLNELDEREGKLRVVISYCDEVANLQSHTPYIQRVSSDGLEPRDITDVPDISTVVPMDASRYCGVICSVRISWMMNDQLMLHRSATQSVSVHAACGNCWWVWRRR